MLLFYVQSLQVSYSSARNLIVTDLLTCIRQRCCGKGLIPGLRQSELQNITYQLQGTNFCYTQGEEGNTLLSEGILFCYYTKYQRAPQQNLPKCPFLYVFLDGRAPMSMQTTLEDFFKKMSLELAKEDTISVQL